MNKQHAVARIAAAVLAAVVLALCGLAAPAQADTGWNGTVAPVGAPSLHLHAAPAPAGT